MEQSSPERGVFKTPQSTTDHGRIREEEGSSSFSPSSSMDFSPMSAADLQHRSEQRRRASSRTPGRILERSMDDDAGQPYSARSVRRKIREDISTRSSPRTPSRARGKEERHDEKSVPIHHHGLTPATVGRNSRSRRSSSHPPPASVLQQKMRTVDLHDTPRGYITPGVAASLAKFQQGLKMTPGNRSVMRTPTGPDSTKKRRDGGLLDSALRNASARKRRSAFGVGGIGGWGGGRDESPMDLLRRLAKAPGVLPQPTPPSIAQVTTPSTLAPTPLASVRAAALARRSAASSARPSANLRLGQSVPGDLTRDGLGDASTSSALAGQESFYLASEASMGRRAATPRRSNIFADLFNERRQSMTFDAADPTPRKVATTSLADVSVGEPSRLDGSWFENEGGREQELEGLVDLDGPLGLGFSSQGDGGGFALDDELSSAARRSRAISEPLDLVDAGELYLDDNVSLDGVAGVGAREDPLADDVPDDYPFDIPSDGGIGGLIEGDDSDTRHLEEGTDPLGLDEEDEFSYDEDDLDAPPTSVETRRKAQAALLRKRVQRRKKNRASPYTGAETPSLPTKLVKDLFATFATPKTGMGANAGNPLARNRVKFEKGAIEGVEDATHHFLADFSQDLVEFAERAGRSSTTISEADVVGLLRAQGHLTAREPLASLSRKLLPRELIDQLSHTIASTSSNSSRTKSSR